jgi:glucosylceramidase
MRVDPAKRAAFIGGHLGPLLARANIRHRDLRLGPQLGRAGVAGRRAGRSPGARYVSGIAWHCYAGDVRRAGRAARPLPGQGHLVHRVLGRRWSPDWAKNLQYFTQDAGDRHHARLGAGVLFWNLALDENDGPHLGGCKDCRGVVTIDSKTGAVTRNVEYYALAHASRFVLPGARRIASSERRRGWPTSPSAIRTARSRCWWRTARRRRAASWSRWASSPSATRCRRPASPASLEIISNRRKLFARVRGLLRTRTVLY